MMGAFRAKPLHACEMFVSQTNYKALTSYVGVRKVCSVELHVPKVFEVQPVELGALKLSSSARPS